MIAPIERPRVSESSPGIRRAHRLLAHRLLAERVPSGGGESAVPGWRAWVYTAWVVLVAAAYVASMSGLFR